MRAAILNGFDQFPELAEVDLADVLPHEVRIQTVAAGVCHSDRHAQTGGNPALSFPIVLGHEAAGVVLEVGAAVTSVSRGDHVVVGPAGSCGLCTWCSRGLPQHCTNLGRERAPGEGSRLARRSTPVSQYVGIGAFAEQMLVRESSVAVVPKELPFDRAALLGCAVITGLGAVRHTASVRVGETVAVIGCGGVGLSAVQGAVLAGASRVIAIDRIPAKLALAEDFGATDLVDASAADPVAAVLALTGGVDHAIEVVGLPATIGQAFDMLGTRGTATVVGLPRSGDTVTLPTAAFMSEKRIQGSRLGGTRLRVDVPLYARMYLDGRLDLDRLLGRTIGLDDVGEALDTLDTSQAGRTVVTC